MRIRVLVAALLLLAVPAGAAAFDRLVNPNHTCSSSGTPEYATLQAAADAALPGDQIGVCPGTYDQTVTIVTPVTFTAIGHVVINGTSAVECVQIHADGVTVRGFEIVGCHAAIAIVANDALIQNNHMRFNDLGIGVNGTDNIVQNNLIENGIFGVLAQFLSDGSEIKNNTLRQFVIGIDLLDTRGVIVNKNLVQDSATGINAHNTTDCTISFNSVSFNEVGIGLLAVNTCQITRNVVTRSSPGPDCFWDGNGTNVFSKNTCRTESPAGAWD